MLSRVFEGEKARRNTSRWSSEEGKAGKIGAYKIYQTPSSSRLGSHQRLNLAQALNLPRRYKRDTLERRSCLWNTSVIEHIKIRHSFLRVLLDDRMRVQSHMFPAGIVVDIICTLANPLGVNGWGKARLGLDRATDHCLGLLGKEKIREVGGTAMAKGVPLEAEPGPGY